MMLEHLSKLQNTQTRRITSWDRSGRNGDFWILEPGESRCIAEIQGPAKLTHLWITQDNPDQDFLRKVSLKIYWDDEEFPSVWAPMGDFFCLGHSMVNSFQSLPFSVSARNDYVFGGEAALNCYLPMPFRHSARIEVHNETEYDHRVYFSVDYETQEDPIPEETAYFHAQFRRENPTVGWAHHIAKDTPLVDQPHLSDRDNYLLLEAEGRGNFIGFNLSVTNLSTYYKLPHKRTWWGEGDEMFFIDGEGWPPSIHGTGSEDALNHAYGMQKNAYLFSGSSLHEEVTGGYQTSYVFYVANPVRFQKSIRASIEHGHGNHLSNEYSSVAYWYQTEPHKPFDLLPPEQRVPLVQGFYFPEGSKTPPTEPVKLTQEMEEALREWEEKYRTRQMPGRY